MSAAGTLDRHVRSARAALESSPDELPGVHGHLLAATGAALAAFDGLRKAPAEPDGVRAVFRALRYVPRAKEALYPLAGAVPAINRFFLSPALRDDPAALVRAATPAGADTGVSH